MLWKHSNCAILYYVVTNTLHCYIVHSLNIATITTGRYKLAEVDLQRALKLKPDFEDARLNLNQVQSDLQSGHQFNLTKQIL